MLAACAHATGSLDQRAVQMRLHGEWDEAARMLDRGIAEARARGDAGGEARLLLRRAQNRSEQARHQGGDRSTVRADLEAAHHKAEALHDPALTAECVDALAMDVYYHWFGSQDPAELAAAERGFRDALALREPLGDSPGLSASYFHIGLVHQMRGEQALAQRAFDQAYAIARRVDDPEYMSHASRHLAYLAELRKNGAAAAALYQQSLTLRERLGGGPGVPAAQVALAELRYAFDGDIARARALLATAREGAARAHSPVYVAISAIALAKVERDAGRFDEALQALAAAVTAMAPTGSDENVVEAHELTALIELLRAQPAAAATAAQRALAVRPSPRLTALLALAGAASDGPAPAGAAPGNAGGNASDAPADDPVAQARQLLARGDAVAALEAAARGDDPDTLLLAARRAGPASHAQAQTAAAGLSRAQAMRFARVLAH